MTGIQKFFMKVLPKKWADDMRAESERWIMTCEGCGRSKSVWEAGGIRWKAASKGKSMIAFCKECGGPKIIKIERL